MTRSSKRNIREYYKGLTSVKVKYQYGCLGIINTNTINKGRSILWIEVHSRPRIGIYEWLRERRTVVAEVFISKCWIILFPAMFMFCGSIIEITCAVVFPSFGGVSL